MLQEFGDGIMSAIDMFATVHTIEGKLGEKRMVITLNGKVRSSTCLKGASANSVVVRNCAYDTGCFDDAVAAAH